MSFMLSYLSTTPQSPIDFKATISVFIVLQYSSAKGLVVALRQLGFYFLLAAALSLKKRYDRN